MQQSRLSLQADEAARVIDRDVKKDARRRRAEERDAVRRWKREEAAPRKAEAKAKFWREMRCFWTWRPGHVYEKTPAKSAKVCMSCGKVVETGSWGGGY